jgi:DNA-binding NarL/FixJ family response regulator
VHSVRVLVGALPDRVRRDVSEVIVREPDVDVVGVASTPSGLLRAAGTLQADVVVVATVDGGLPGVATHLVDQYPDIRVVAVAPEGGSALLYALRPQVDSFLGSSLADLAKQIRAACDEDA